MTDDDGRLYDDENPDWTDDDEDRYQARRRQELRRVRRRRRQAGSFAVVVLLVFGVGLGAAGIYQGWWEWPFGDDPAATVDATDPDACPGPTATAALPADTTVTVLNATETRGLAAAVAAELQARGITVTSVGNDDADVADVAQVRYGPESTLQARTIAAQFPGAVLVDDQRAGTDVELSVGTAFTALNPVDVAAAAVAPVPGESPSGCVTPAPTTPTDPAATTPAPAP